MSPEQVTEQAVEEFEAMIAEIPEALYDALNAKCPNWYRDTQDHWLAKREPDIFGELADRAEYACDRER